LDLLETHDATSYLYLLAKVVEKASFFVTTELESTHQGSHTTLFKQESYVANIGVCIPVFGEVDNVMDAMDNAKLVSRLLSFVFDTFKF
jgi:hypothetical protein